MANQKAEEMSRVGTVSDESLALEESVSSLLLPCVCVCVCVCVCSARLARLALRTYEWLSFTDRLFWSHSNALRRLIGPVQGGASNADRDDGQRREDARKRRKVSEGPRPHSDEHMQREVRARGKDGGGRGGGGGGGRGAGMVQHSNHVRHRAAAAPRVR